MLRLIILRHAEAETKAGKTDRERELTDQGRKDALAIGEKLVAERLKPELVIASPATRTRQTLALAAEAFAEELPVIEDEHLYGFGDVMPYLDALAAHGEGKATVLMVGHNPSVHELVATLASNPQAASRGFPTAGAAVIDFSLQHWDQIGPGKGILAAFLKP